MSWNPLQDLMMLQDRMNRLFEDATHRRSERAHVPTGAAEASSFEKADWKPLADVYENEDEYTIALDLPGIDRAALNISLDDNRLVIRGQREADGREGTRSERPFGSFLRTFTLPGSVDQNSIRADYKDGVLQIHLPRSKNYGKRVQIKVS